jgi:polyhydroxybutyrate depolymerase
VSPDDDIPRCESADCNFILIYKNNLTCFTQLRVNQIIAINEQRKMKSLFRPLITALMTGCLTLSACGGGGSDTGAPSVVAAPVDNLPQGKPGDFTKTVSVAGVTRTFLLHVPGSYKNTESSPAVLLFHGGQGSAGSIGGITSSTAGGFSAFADQKNFIAIYPDSVSGTWDDGRATITNRTNDVAFTAALLDAVALEYNLDTKRVFAAGISNGGMMVLRLACELSGRISAVAAVAANMPSDLQASCNPAQALPVAMLSGDADPLMPYSGGTVAGVFGGSVMSTTATAAFWANKNSATLSSTSTLPNTDTTDGTTTDLFSYTNTSNREVAFYRINGGGHTWPGGTQYALMALIGKVARDFSANEAIWAFFQRHAKP